MFQIIWKMKTNSLIALRKHLLKKVISILKVHLDIYITGLWKRWEFRWESHALHDQEKESAIVWSNH